MSAAHEKMCISSKPAPYRGFRRSGEGPAVEARGAISDARDPGDDAIAKASTGPGRRPYLVGIYTVVAMATLAVFPSSLLVTLVTGSHRIGHRLHARLWGRLILALCGVSLRVHGLERLSADRAYVLMCNHASHFDGYAVAAALPLQWRAVLGAWIRPIPVFGWIGMLAGHVFLDRSRSGRAIPTLNRAVAKIHGGLSVLIFPEGTFNEGGPLSPFKRGGFHLAVAAGVPVVPMTVVETVVGSIRRVRAIDLYIGAPRETSGLNDDALPDLMASVRAEMARHGASSPPPGDRPRRSDSG